MKLSRILNTKENNYKKQAKNSIINLYPKRKLNILDSKL
jgi:hypothetical protein